MSKDLRHRFAYFGPREKIYKNGKNTEILGLPYNWRRILSISYPSHVVGPFGCIYSDVEHAMCAYRYLYTSNRPIYANIFRSEISKMQGTFPCKRWGSSNGMSLLMSNPNDRLWNLIRDQCMFELIYQRISRDKEYRFILSVLFDNQYLPVYHVRTAIESTYWGATIDRNFLSNTLTDRSPKGEKEEMYLGAEKNYYQNRTTSLIGQNRLGEIMIDALQAYRQVYTINQDADNTTTTSIEKIYDLLQFRFDYPITPLNIPENFHTSPKNECESYFSNEEEVLEEESSQQKKRKMSDDISDCSISPEEIDLESTEEANQLVNDFLKQLEEDTLENCPEEYQLWRTQEILQRSELQIF